MLVNKNNNINSHVKFVDYTGRYPTLCMGILTLEIDGEKYTFGSVWKEPKPDFGSFWHSSGGITGDYSHYSCYSGEWEIDVEALPEQFRKYATEIDDVFNSNVEYGCCGGCI